MKVSGMMMPDLLENKEGELTFHYNLTWERTGLKHQWQTATKRQPHYVRKY